LHLQGSSNPRRISWAAWPLKTGPIGSFEMSVTTNQRRITPKNSEHINCTAA
jgi:hypothetical protein